jgi:primosomal protein N'
MYIVSVAPIKRGLPIEELSYFSKDEIAAGTLVTVPLRGRPTPALVLRSSSVSDAKAELKQAEFSLKKLERVRRTNLFSPYFIAAAEATARYHGATLGATLATLFPADLLATKDHKDGHAPSRAPRIGTRHILQAEEEERMATYKSHIREVFARGSSCYFVLPTLADIEHAYTKLEKGIASYTFILHSGLSKKELEKRWTAILTTEHPVLVIGTPLFLSIPRHDIESVILDRESASGFQGASRPFIDLRHYVEAFADARGADLILGDLFLRVETIERFSRGEFEALLRPKSRVPSTANSRVVDMRALGEQPATGKIAFYSAELVDVIEETRTRGERCFILGVRRGYAPMTVCGDCATVILCEKCSAPMVIHKRGRKDASGEDEFIFLCHRCGDERDTDVNCPNCGGWRLIPLGIGIAQAEEAIKRRFPDAQIFRIDRDSVEKHADAKKIAERFYATPGAIMIGTEMALPYLTQPISSIGVLSVNSLLTIPDFRMGERVFRLLLALRERAREHFVIQTRDAGLGLLELAAHGNIGEFVREELTTRKELGYPPFRTLIKFTYRGSEEEGRRALSDLERIFSVYHPVTFPSFIGKVKGKYVMNALLFVPREDPKSAWPNDEILSLIRSLPPEIEVRVNPDSVV